MSWRQTSVLGGLIVLFYLVGIGLTYLMWASETVSIYGSVSGGRIFLFTALVGLAGASAYLNKGYLPSLLLAWTPLVAFASWQRPFQINPQIQFAPLQAVQETVVLGFALGTIGFFIGVTLRDVRRKQYPRELTASLAFVVSILLTLTVITVWKWSNTGGLPGAGSPMLYGFGIVVAILLITTSRVDNGYGRVGAVGILLGLLVVDTGLNSSAACYLKLGRECLFFGRINPLIVLLGVVVLSGSISLVLYTPVLERVPLRAREAHSN